MLLLKMCLPQYNRSSVYFDIDRLSSSENSITNLKSRIEGILGHKKYRLGHQEVEKKLIPFFIAFNGKSYITLKLWNLNEVPIDFHYVSMSWLLLSHTFNVKIGRCRRIFSARQWKVKCCVVSSASLKLENSAHWQNNLILAKFSDALDKFNSWL